MKTRHLPTLPALLLLVALVVALPPAAGADEVDYREAMKRGQVALDRNEYAAAARAFAEARREAAGDALAGEALYWRAFALHRQSGKKNLHEAARELRALEHAAATNAHLREEARTLAMRIKGDLARMGDAEAARDLAAATTEQDDLDLKLAALQAMMQMKPERALPVLVKILADRRPETVALRQHALFLVGEIDREAAVPLLIETAREDPDPEIRQQCAFWLGQTGDPAALEFLKQEIAQAQDPEDVEHLLFAVSQLDDGSANGLLRDIVADATRPDEMRAQAIFGLGRNGTRADRQFLREMFGTLDDPELQEHVIFAAGQGDDPETATWLAGLVQDDSLDMEARKQALFWAGQQGLVPVGNLTSMYESSQDRDLRAQVIFVLSQSDDPTAVQQLMTIARTEDDVELRTQAVFWVGQSGAEGGEDFLLEIIGNRR